MIITRTPYRVSFFGGGTDYEKWYSKHGGQVLTCTLNKFCYIGARYMPAFLGSKYRIFWSKMEQVDERDQIQHSGVRGCLEVMEIDKGIEVNHMGDLPARSGLGSSSAFTVGMLNALYALEGNNISTQGLADLAIYVEQTVLKETVGIQDQIACAFGGFNHIVINKGGSYTISPIASPEELEENLILFYTGIQRYASDIAQSQVNNVDSKEEQLTSISYLVTTALKCLKEEAYDDFGELLHFAWSYKKQLSDKVSNEVIDEIYDRARVAGALGGKILGAGGGGFLLLYVKERDRSLVREKLSHLIEVPFSFGTRGSEIMVNSP